MVFLNLEILSSIATVQGANISAMFITRYLHATNHASHMMALGWAYWAEA